MQIAALKTSAPRFRDDGLAAAPAAAEGVTMHFARDEEIFGEGEAADCVYRVVSGAVRLFRVLSDGRRQIIGFHLPGEVFGLDSGDQRTLSAEAVGKTTLLASRRSIYFKANPSEALEALLAACDRAEAHMLVLGRHTASERVCALLLDLAARAKASIFTLPMSRQDIADHLGLTIETVSRTFTQLQADGWVDLVTTRQVRLPNPRVLERACA